MGRKPTELQQLIARLAVVTGISPNELADTDLPVLQEMVRVLEQRPKKGLGGR